MELKNGWQVPLFPFCETTKSNDELCNNIAFLKETKQNGSFIAQVPEEERESFLSCAMGTGAFVTTRQLPAEIAEGIKDILENEDELLKCQKCGEPAVYFLSGRSVKERKIFPLNWGCKFRTTNRHYKCRFLYWRFVAGYFMFPRPAGEKALQQFKPWRRSVSGRELPSKRDKSRFRIFI